MAERPPSWPPRGSDREFAPDDDREFPRGDREFQPHSWPPVGEREDREDVAGPRVSPEQPRGAEETSRSDDEVGLRVPAYISPLREFRFVRNATTSAEHIDYAINGAYSLSNYEPWRKANIIFAYTVATVGTLLCDVVKWAFFERLSRFLIAIPTALALAWLLNHIPVTAWLIPDGWDLTTWWQPDPAITVEVPVPAPTGEG